MATARKAPAALLLAAALFAGCGSGDEDSAETSSPLADPAATEAAPEAAAEPAPEGSLPADDEQAVSAATRAYIDALNADDGEAVCALLAPGALEGVRLPRPGAGCAGAVEGSIGYRGPGGTPAWKRTRIYELTAVAVNDDRARVTATVSHDFAGRNEPSVEEDVIYLDRAGEGGEWLLAKPSASFYRAVGYPEPPLSSLTPP